MPSLKQWLDGHPASIVLGIAVSVATAASGFTGSLIDQLHKAEAVQVANHHQLEITDLNSRLSSIERRAGPDQPKRYLDVQSMQLAPTEIRNLPQIFASYDDGRFFLNSPISKSWSYGFMPYGEVGKLSLFRPMVEMVLEDRNIKAALDANIGHTWYSSPAAEARYALDTDDLKFSGPLVSHVRIQKVTRQSYSEAATMVAQSVREASTSKHSNADATIDEIQRLTKEETAEKGNDTLDVNSTTQKLFERLFDGDTAGLVFVDILFQNWQFGNIGPNVSFSILSAQKQLNVMYVDLELRLTRTEIIKSYDESCKEKSTPTISVRREIFFVSYGGGGYLISTQVPTCDGRSKAFDWISQWLSGLRLAMRSVS
jgi:hypothetical protein